MQNSTLIGGSVHFSTSLSDGFACVIRTFVLFFALYIVQRRRECGLCVQIQRNRFVLIVRELRITSCFDNENTYKHALSVQNREHYVIIAGFSAYILGSNHHYGWQMVMTEDMSPDTSSLWR